MDASHDLLRDIRAINDSAAFNRWCGIEVERAEPGSVEIAMPWRAEGGQYAGFLHAGLVGALIDTACGFAAATLVGRVLAKPGKTQVFTSCRLYAVASGEEKLVATGETLLVVAG